MEPGQIEAVFLGSHRIRRTGDPVEVELHGQTGEDLEACRAFLRAAREKRIAA